MPRITNVSDIADMDVGQPIPVLKGTIKRKFDRTTGKSKRGRYSFENFILEDVHEEDEEIKVTLKNCPPLEFDDGDTICICASEGGKGWAGVEVAENEYPKGEFTIIVECTESAEILDASEFEDGGEEEEEERPSRKKKTSRRESTRKPASRKSSREEKPSRAKRSKRKEYIPDEEEEEEASGDSEGQLIERLFQAGNHYLRSYAMVHSINTVATGAGLPPMSAEQIHGATSTLFINTQNKNLLAGMPKDEITIPEIDDSPVEEEEEKPRKRRSKAKAKEEYAEEEEEEEEEQA